MIIKHIWKLNNIFIFSLNSFLDIYHYRGTIKYQIVWSSYSFLGDIFINYNYIIFTENYTIKMKYVTIFLKKYTSINNIDIINFILSTVTGHLK